MLVRTIAFVMFVLSTTAFASSGWFIEQIERSKPDKKSQSVESKVLTYISGERYRQERSSSQNSQPGSIGIYNGKVLYVCMPAKAGPAKSSDSKGSCFVMTPEATLKLTNAITALGNTKVEQFELRATGKDKRIQGFSCKGYFNKMRMASNMPGMAGSTDSTIETEGCYALKPLVVPFKFENKDGKKQTDLEKKFIQLSKLGIPLEQKTTNSSKIDGPMAKMMGVNGRSRSTVTLETKTIRAQNVPDQMFDVPAGYSVGKKAK